MIRKSKNVLKVILLLFVLSCSIVLFSGILVENVYAQDIVVTSAQNINVRSQPNTSSKVLGKLNSGIYLLRYENRSDGWSYIDFGGTPAYIKSDFIKLAPSGTSGLVPSTTTANKSSGIVSNQNYSAVQTSVSNEATVYATATGECYHSKPNCGRTKKAYEITLDDARRRGLRPCSKCMR